MYKIIAETAFSHEGDLSYLMRQIDEASKGKVDYVKFQVFIDLDQYLVLDHSSRDIVKKWMFTKTEWESVFKYAREKNVKVLVLPLNVASTEFCLSLDSLIDVYEVHSVCFNDMHLLELLKKTEKTIVLGVGGRLLKEISGVLKVLNKPKEKIILMHGFQSFPTDKSMLNLGKLKTYAGKFDCDLGYADHSSFEDNSYQSLNAYAYFSGVRYFEKHIVLEKGVKRIDFETGVEGNDFLKIRKGLLEISKIYGNEDGNFLNEKEAIYREREKKPVFSRAMNKGEVMTISDLCFKIVEETKGCKDLNVGNIIGKTLLNDVIRDQIIVEIDFE